MNSHIEFTAFGVYAADFINALIAADLSAYDITSVNGIYTLKTKPQNYREIAAIARRYKVKTRVTARAGLYFRLRRYRRRWGIPAGVLAFFAIIVAMTNHVWSVKVSGNEQISSYYILEELAERGIRPGAGIRSFNTTRAELELSLKIDEIAWVSIERTGSRVNVKISERIPEDKNEIPAGTPCNVIAAKSGQLVKAEVYCGELLYELGSGINAGDVVVSGIEGGAAVHADARIIVETSETLEFYQPYTTHHRAKNGHSLTNRSVVFLGLRFGSDVKVNKNADHVDYRETMYAPRLWGFPLPYRVLKQDYVFNERVQVTESPAAAREMLDRQIGLYIQNFLNNAEIVEQQAEYFPDDNGIKAVVRFVYRINVAEKREIFM